MSASLNPQSVHIEGATPFTRVCSCCGFDKPIDAFYPGYTKCKSCKRAASRNTLWMIVKTLRYNARNKGVICTLTTQEVEEVLVNQGGVCAITGLAFQDRENRTNKPGHAEWNSLSFDRIDHGGPYVKSNIRLVLHCINSFRQGMDDDLMVEVARALVKRMVI